MYSILIVEDEQIERESLVTNLSRSMLQLEHIYEAKNGIEALAKYDKYHPDIVLLDIHLPGCSGLECARQMKKKAGKKMIKFIIQTSYDYFSYAHEAISIGVEDFILKPANPQKVIESISKIIESSQIEINRYLQTSSLLDKLNNMKSALELDCIKLILTNQSEILIQKTFSLLHMTVKSGMCICIKVDAYAPYKQQNLKNDMEDMGYASLINYEDGQLIIFILYPGKLTPSNADSIKEVLYKHEMFRYEIGIGNITNEIHGLYGSYLYAISYAAKLKPEDFHIYEKMKDKEQYEYIVDCKAYVSYIMQALENDDDDTIINQSRMFVNTLLSLPENAINMYVKEFIVLLKEQLTHTYQVDFSDSSLEIFTITELTKYNNLEVRMMYTIHTLITPIKNMLYQNVNQLTKRALKYMRKHYNKAISLNDVADSLHVSPFYLSKLLNKQVNKTFTDLITEYRIDQAKQLLKEHYAVKVVASMVGYRSSGYFSKSFKKLIGVTPTEYRDIFI